MNVNLMENLLALNVGQLIPLAALMVPIAALCIPIVAILTQHQRKMAELMRDQRQSQAVPEIAELRARLDQMQAQINQQTIALDDIRSALASGTSVQERLNAGS